MNFKDLLPKSLPFTSSKETAEYFFALHISQDLVEAAVWGMQGNKLILVKTASQKYSTGDDPNKDGGTDLIEAANLALDDALATFEPEPTKVLFGVPDFWLQDEDLKPDFLKLLRKMVKHLDIEPMAYVSTTHAISNMLQRQQGTPPTVILVDLSDPLLVTVIKGGKVVASRTQKRGEDLPKDIEKALLSLTEVEVLPSKIVIYGSEKAEKLKEELVSYSWLNQLPFLHLPKVETLDMGDSLKSVCFAGASELNPDVNFHFSEPELQRPQTASHIKSAHKLKEDDLGEAGFVEGDINDQLDLEQERSVTLNPTVYPQQSMGNQYFESTRSKFFPTFLNPILDPVLAFFAKLPFPAKMPKLVVILPIVFLILLVGAYIFIPKANVTVFLDLRVLEKETQVIADPKVTAVDEANKKIPGKTVSTTVNGSASGQATGRKQVGESSKGKVILYNATNSPVTISENTVLSTGSGIKFKLDSEVQIASKSASAADPPTKSGAVGATASAIGPDGNIAGGTDLTVGNYSKSDIVAKVDSAFSGGVSKDVIVVTSDDQKRLLAELSSELRKKAADEIQGKLTDGMKVLNEGLTEDITKQTFSKKVGDQAQNFDLNLTASYEGTAYNENDLKLIVSKLVETTVPEGFTLDLSQTETQADVSKIEKDGRLIFAAKFKAKLMPKVDANALKKQIAGKTPAQVADIVRKIPNVIGSDIEINPSLPGPFQRLPFLPQNITVNVTAK